MKTKKKKQFHRSKGVGDSHNISPIPSGSMKAVMPTRCNACQIGIGTSMIYENKVWKEHRHMNQKINEINGKVYCSDCYKEIKKKMKSNKFVREV